MDSNKPQKNDFVRERIKDKPMNKRRLLERIGLSAVCGVVFGVTACLAVWVCSPLLNRAQARDGQEMTDTEPSTDRIALTEKEEVSTEKEELPPPEPLHPEITVEDFQQMQDQLYEIGRSANRSVVIITSVTSDASRFHTMYEKQGQTSGVIFREKKEEYLILAQEAKFAEPTQIAVTFVDGSVSRGEILGYDGMTGLAVVAVKKADMDSAAISALAVNSLNSPAAVEEGALTLLLGSSIGSPFSILTGNVVSTGENIPMIDGNYSSFTTDIASDNAGRGILVNTEGMVTGLVMMKGRLDSSQEATVTAVCVAELLPLVRKLSSGQDIPYLGAYVSTVTDRLAENYNLPRGVYVDSVVVDSPAMTGGLQSGDVITQISGKEIGTDEEYRSAVQELTPGEICEITVSRQNGEGYSEITCEVETGILR